MNKNGIDVQVCVKGRPIREFGYEGRTLVEGRKGALFTVKVKNNLSKRVMVVVGVDGVNVISGDDSTTQGYIIEAYSSYDIKGWRQSLDGVASFVFKEKDGSYSKAIKGSDAQCGVISVIAYHEKERKPIQVVEKHVHHHHDYYDPWYPWLPRPRVPYPGIPYPGTPIWTLSKSVGPLGTTGADGATGASGSDGWVDGSTFTTSSAGGGSTLRSMSVSNHGAEQSAVTASYSCSTMNLGAGWGEALQDSVTEVSFQTGKKICTFDLYYTDAKGLKALGIDPHKSPAIQTFPAGLGSFCRPPA